MRIFQGIRDSSEVLPLRVAGADEFYTALVDNDGICLRNHYPPMLGLTRMDELDDTVEHVDRVGSKLFIAVNELHYGGPTVESYVEWMALLADRGVDGFIISSIPLLLAAGRAGLGTELCVSTLQPVLNPVAAAVCKSLGADRLVFPEHAGAYEVNEILEDPDLKTESFFWLSHDCTNMESYCLFHH